MEEEKKNKKIAYIASLIILPVATFVFGLFLNLENKPAIETVHALFNKDVPGEINEEVDFSSFWKAWQIIDEKYPFENGPTTEEKVWGAISGLAGSLDDPYTTFLRPDEMKMFDENISGEFEGVGMEIGIRDGVLTVIAPLPDTPANLAGVESGDQIIEIDGESTQDMSTDKAVGLIRGQGGTEVVLTIVREGENEPIELSITRDTISIPTIETETLEEDIFLISLYNFSANSTELFQDALQEFIDSGKDKLILDLRNNPGGYLEASIDMASWFLESGKPIVIEDFGGKRDQEVHRSRGYDIFSDQLQMKVLVNRGSASASEILAGALSEHGVAETVGSQTFGKGSVQELASITSNTSLKVTIAKWLTPEGVSISENGITPDHEVEFDVDELDEDRDSQLQKAIDLLVNN